MIEDLTLEDIGADQVYMRGPKKDITKRLATMQVCIRVQGKQIMKPTLILRNEHPAEDRYAMSPGLAKREVVFIIQWEERI